MALVMLPCDLPWWGAVKKQLHKLESAKNALDVTEFMQKIHDMCCVSLDPEEDPPDPEQFVGLLNFLDNDLTSEERGKFFSKTLPAIATRAQHLKDWKPPNGLHFSLQQQPDFIELSRGFVSSLIANAFFSTFPKRTERSHPTLQNFNFAYFFKYLKNNVQKAKLRSVLRYFDWLELQENENGTITYLRQVMTSKEWLTIEDWLECTLPLCALQIRHEGRLDRVEGDTMLVCFARPKLGGVVLSDGHSQECINFSVIPEMLSVLLNVEALEDNEIYRIESVTASSRIVDPKVRSCFEAIELPQKMTVCCVDAEDYSKLPLGQYEEDNVLRELNKCLLAFQQKPYRQSTEPFGPHPQKQVPPPRRLSPIGESYSDNAIPIIITQQSCSTTKSESPTRNAADNTNGNTLRVMRPEIIPRRVADLSPEAVERRRGRFIVLGSSGECLPVKRPACGTPALEISISSSLDSSESEEFHSAQTSLGDGEGSDDGDDFDKRYNAELETSERRGTFAQRLREALRREHSSLTTSTESSYAVGISVAGSGLSGKDIKVKRKGSTGFALQEDSLDEDFLNDSMQREKQWIDKFRNKQSSVLSRKESNRSSDYSFSTDYSCSELEEVYEQFSKWLEDPQIETGRGMKRKLDARDMAVVQFAGSLLKRTLSESFAGVQIAEGCDQGVSPPVCPPDAPISCTGKQKLVLNAKSLSLELARYKHKLASQLSQHVEPLAVALESKRTQELVVTEVANNGDSSVDVEVVVSRKPHGKPRLNWVATCVTAVVQTLEDICVCVTLPPAIKNIKLSQIAQRPPGGIRPVATGNWGCGSSQCGAVQLKALIQWLAASVAGVPVLMYYTCGHRELAAFDTVCRLLVDRRWTVRDMTQAMLRYSTRVIEGRQHQAGTLFEELIGVERTIS